MLTHLLVGIFIHYHFPTKAALVIAIIQKHLILLEKFKENVSEMDSVQKIIKFLSVYAITKSEGRISILGSLSNDYFTFTAEVQTELKILTNNTLNWLTDTLKEGRQQGFFHYDMEDRKKALVIITNILGAEQLSRVTDNRDFHKIKEAIINDLIK